MHLCTLLYLNVDAHWQETAGTQKDVGGDKLHVSVNIECSSTPSEGSTNRQRFVVYLRVVHAQLGQSHGALGLRLERSTLDHLAGGNASHASTNRIPSASRSTSVLQNHTATSTCSEPCLALVRSWIRECATTHGECSQKARGNKAMPTRLVDLTSGSNALRIHRTSPVSNLKFVALSHYWGGAIFLRLQAQNYVDLSDEFYISDLPKAWHEAISLARLLGYDYIWIDALCIIQDSEYDWETEAVLMGDAAIRCYLSLATCFLYSSMLPGQERLYCCLLRSKQGILCLTTVQSANSYGLMDPETTQRPWLRSL